MTLGETLLVHLEKWVEFSEEEVTITGQLMAQFSLGHVEKSGWNPRWSYWRTSESRYTIGGDYNIEAVVPGGSRDKTEKEKKKKQCLWEHS